MRRFFLSLAALLGVAVLSLAAVLYSTFAGQVEPRAASWPGLGHLVLDGYVSIGVIDVGGGKLALVDAGNDATGAALLADLAANGRSPSDVVAVFLTHGHRDHILGLGLLPGATVYGMAAEAPFLSGASKWRGPIPYLLGGGEDTGVVLGHPLRDGEVVQVGDRAVTAFAVPGHTAGSAAYLVDGKLFVGDNATFNVDGSLRPAPWIFSDDPAENRASLARLGQRLQGAAVDEVICAHSGPGTLAALQAFGAGTGGS